MKKKIKELKITISSIFFEKKEISKQYLTVFFNYLK